MTDRFVDCFLLETRRLAPPAAVLALLTALAAPSLAQDGSELWRFDIGSPVGSSPAVAADGTIYVGELLAFNPDGSLRWTHPAGPGRGHAGLQGFATPASSPAVGSDGTVYYSTGWDLFSVFPDGGTRWRYTVNNTIRSSPAVTEDGTVYFTSKGAHLYLHKLTPEGIREWFTSPLGQYRSSPVIGDEDTLYLGALQTHAISSGGGDKWVVGVGVRDSSPAVGAGGTIFVGSNQGDLVALDRGGTVLWRAPLGATTDVSSSPAIGEDGTIYIGSDDGHLYAVDFQGQEKWRFATGGTVVSSPAVGADGTIFVGSSDGNLYAVTSEGTELWRFVTGGPIDSSPAIAPDGTIYVGSDDGNLYAVSSSAGGLADSPWPMFRHDLQHTGRSSGLVLSTNGTCPGSLTVSVSGATPGGTIALLGSSTPGSTILPGGPCAGAEVGLDGPRLLAVTVADSAGRASLEREVGDAVCGAQLQAVDPGSCWISQVTPVP